MKISAQILVKNESRFVWYSVMSVIKYVDRIRIWDTGSTDGTVEIIEEIAKTPEARGKEIFDFRKLGDEDFDEEKLRQTMLDFEVEDKFVAARHEMLEATTASWFIVVDADEIWWDDSIKKLTNAIRNDGEKYDSIVVPTINVVGDLFHYQEKQAGRYHLAGREGHYNLRAINKKIPGLHARGGHGTFTWADRKDRKIEAGNTNRILYLDAPYIHTTHLNRSGSLGGDKSVFKRAGKGKHELGISFPGDFYYPEVFFRPRPKIVSSVWYSNSPSYKFRAFFETPLRKIYRRTFLQFKKHGY